MRRSCPASGATPTSVTGSGDRRGRPVRPILAARRPQDEQRGREGERGGPPAGLRPEPGVGRVAEYLWRVERREVRRGVVVLTREGPPGRVDHERAEDHERHQRREPPVVLPERSLADLRAACAADPRRQCLPLSTRRCASLSVLGLGLGVVPHALVVGVVGDLEQVLHRETITRRPGQPRCAHSPPKLRS